MNAVLLNGNLNGNSSKPSLSASWKRQTVRQFFGSCNWDDQSLKVQALKLAVTQSQGSDQPLSLTLKVQEFFAAVNWDGSSIAAFSIAGFSTLETIEDTADNLTLDDFSNLF